MDKVEQNIREIPIFRDLGVDGQNLTCYSIYVMDEQYRTPGQLIRALLTERDWTQLLLSAILGIDENAVSQIIAGRRPVTAELSIALSEVFGESAERFLRLQRSYDLARAEIEVLPNPGRAQRGELFGRLPVREMMKRGWLDVADIREVNEVEKALSRFFGVESVDQIEVLPHAAKKTEVFTDANPAQLAWIYRVREIAKDMMVTKYSQAAVTEAVSLLEQLRLVPEQLSKAPRILAEHGIRYAIVESLPTAKIDGVAFWLDSESPVIGMSLRFDRVDNFLFVLRHELEHILRLHGRDSETVMLDAELEGENAGSGPDIAEEERLANEAASNFCVPRDMMDKFIAHQSPRFALRDFLGFANVLHVHPGLVAGQLQNRTGRYDLFRKYLVKVNHIIVPNARADGWGKTALSTSIGG